MSANSSKRSAILLKFSVIVLPPSENGLFIGNCLAWLAKSLKRSEEGILIPDVVSWFNSSSVIFNFFKSFCIPKGKSRSFFMPLAIGISGFKICFLPFFWYLVPVIKSSVV